MVKVRRNMVPKDKIGRVTNSGKNPVKYIVVHETDNTSKGADADAHSRLQKNGNPRIASWHYSVDDKEVVQSFEDSVRCLHAGNSSYNRNSIGVEICVNSDGNFRKAVENAAGLVKAKMQEHNVPLSNVVQHNKASGKNCPRNLRSGSKGINWNDFKKMVEGKKVTVKPSESKPSKKPSGKLTVSQMADLVISGQAGNGHDNRRKYLGISQSEYNKVVAEVNKRYGVSGSKPSKKPASKPKNVKVGDKVTLSKNAKTFATGESILDSAKGKRYTVIQVKSDRVLLKEIMSWARKADVGLGGSSGTASKPKPKTLKKGSRVRIKRTAKSYSRTKGTSIPSRFKGPYFTVQQVGKNDVLIKELYSWVRKTDVY